MIETIHTDTCPICKSHNIKHFIQGKDFLTTQESFNIEKCESCGFLFTQDFPSEKHIGSYYLSDNYISHSDSRNGLFNKLYHRVRRYMLKSKAKLVEKQWAEKGTLLDIGAGTGYFANEMKQRGWRVSAMEKNPEARNFIQKNWHIDAQDENALSQIQQHSFQVITLWHVLEHLEHLHEIMQQLHSILQHNGTLIIALPNAASYDAKKYKSFWAAYDLPRHLWHFTPQTFALLASQHQFKIVKTKRMAFDVFYICLLSEKYRGKPAGVLRALIMAITGWFLSIFNINNSSSLIYVLKKND
jgi:2-polyprenyl-3-methyl-5-hydroxy-6-metoxy-1,4-benzoquinol methylase